MLYALIVIIVGTKISEIIVMRVENPNFASSLTIPYRFTGKDSFGCPNKINRGIETNGILQKIFFHVHVHIVFLTQHIYKNRRCYEKENQQNLFFRVGAEFLKKTLKKSGGHYEKKNLRNLFDPVPVADDNFRYVLQKKNAPFSR